MRATARRRFQRLRRSLSSMPEHGREAAQAVIDREGEVLDHFRAVATNRIRGSLIRGHGDYHLGQVLFTGNDFVIIDFEGEPARPLSERRIKRGALRDVAGMLRSFHYAPYAVVFGQSEGSVIRSEDVAALDAGSRFWHRWTGAAFLRAYLDESGTSPHLPHNRSEVRVLLDAYLLEKVLYEIAYELNNRPEWVRIPLRGALELLG